MIEIDVLSILSTRENWDRIGGQFSPEYFDGPTHRTLYELIQSYWSRAPKSIKRISLDIFEKLIKGRVPDIEERARVARLAAKIVDVNPDQIVPIVKDALLSWKAKSIILQASDQLDRWEFDPSITAAQFDDLARAIYGSEEEEISPSLSPIEILKEEATVHTFPTGISDLDLALKGGLWTSELGLLIAPVYAGKTFVLCHFGATALRDDTPVQHWTTEITRARVALRYYQNLLKCDRDYLIANPEEVETRLRDMGLPPWSIQDYSSSGVSTAVMKRKAQEFADKCDKPPLILVDHIELGSVRPIQSNLEGRFALAAVAEELRQIAASLPAGVWTAVQANRPAFGSSHIRMENAAESLGPPRKADVIITINQNDEEKATNTMRLHIDKARERVIVVPTVPVLAVTPQQRLEDLP